MEEERMETTPQQEQEYEPRSKRQVWMARIGLVFFLAFLVMFYIVFFRGV